MKEITHDLNHDFYHLTAHTINCVCQSIRSMFRVPGISNFALIFFSTSASKIRPTKNCKKNHDDFNRINKKLLKTFNFWRPVIVEILFLVSSLNWEAWKRIVKSIFLSIIKFMQQFGCTTLNSNAERARNLENPFTYTMYIQNTKYSSYFIPLITLHCQIFMHRGI